jgi:hypothetical protein
MTFAWVFVGPPNPRSLFIEFLIPYFMQLFLCSLGTHYLSFFLIILLNFLSSISTTSLSLELANKRVTNFWRSHAALIFHFLYFYVEYCTSYGMDTYFTFKCESPYEIGLLLMMCPRVFVV